MDTLRFVWRALRAQIPMCWQRMGSCASKHNWPITIYLTAGAWFMNCWLLVGRQWRNRQQRPLVLDMCRCHTKSQWVTVTLTDSSVYLSYCWEWARKAFIFFRWCGPFRLALIADNTLKINLIQTHHTLQEYLTSNYSYLVYCMHSIEM